MVDFSFLQNPLSKKWVILAPRRAKRPDVASGIEPGCPFCPGREKDEVELYRIPVSENSEDSTWSVRVIPNKFPFAPIHEIVIHSPDHHKNFGELPLDQVGLILQTYRHRYNEHSHKGQVYIFHNRGEAGGESLPHPHTQIAVVPFEVKMDIPRLDPSADAEFSPKPFSLSDNSVIGSQFSVISKQSVSFQSARSETDKQTTDKPEPDNRQPKTDNKSFLNSVQTDYFYLFCPKTSQWPDEVWVAPKVRGRAFGEITDMQIKDLAFILQRLIQILDLRHGHEFPYNFYIYPGGDWYLRLLPRVKSLGGFEIGTGIYINTQDPAETIAFIKTHFHQPDEEKIKKENQADYQRSV